MTKQGVMSYVYWDTDFWVEQVTRSSYNIMLPGFHHNKQTMQTYGKIIR
jgi:hypothetical protein